MEVTNASRTAGPDTTELIPLRVGKSTISAIEDYSKEAGIFLEKQGGEIHPIFDRDEKYLQQRYTVPTPNTFQYATRIS